MNLHTAQGERDTLHWHELLLWPWQHISHIAWSAIACGGKRIPPLFHTFFQLRIKEENSWPGATLPRSSDCRPSVEEVLFLYRPLFPFPRQAVFCDDFFFEMVQQWNHGKKSHMDISRSGTEWTTMTTSWTPAWVAGAQLFSSHISEVEFHISFLISCWQWPWQVGNMEKNVSVIKLKMSWGENSVVDGPKTFRNAGMVGLVS